MSELDAIARQVNPHGEQAQHATQQWALQVVAYYRTLRQQGVGVEPATYLTRDWQALHLQHAFTQGSQ